MFEKTETFTPVVQKISGHVRKNGLYYFVKNNFRSLAFLSNYSLSKSKSEERKVLYLYPNTLVAPQPLFRGIPPTNTHLSIDKVYSRENSSQYPTYTPIHLTVCYNPFRLHVFFNEHGVMVYHHVKNDSTGEYILLSPQEIEQITKQGKALESLILQIVQMRTQKYFQLNNALSEKETQLSCSKTKEQYVEHAKEYLTLLKELDNYSDHLEMSRGEYVVNMIAQLETPSIESPQTITQIPIVKTENEPVTSTPILSHHATALSPISLLKKYQTTLSQTIDTILAHDDPNDLNTLIPLFKTVEDLCLAISFEKTNSAIKKFVKKEKKRLNKTLEDLIHLFEEKLLMGDLSFVQSNLNIVSNAIPLTRIFERFFKDFYQARSDESLQRKKESVAKYLYEHSQVYRILVLLIPLQFYQYKDTELLYGFALKMLTEDNFYGFQDSIKHYIASDYSQLILDKTNFTLLPAVIILYQVNPKIEFVKAVLDKSPILTFRAVEYTPDVIYYDQFLEALSSKNELINHIKPQKTKSIKMTRQEKAETKEKKFDELVKSLSELEHVIEIAVSLYHDQYPDLIECIAEKTDATSLMEILGMMLVSPLYTPQFICDASKDTTDTTIQIELLMNQAEIKSLENQNTFESTRAILHHAKMSLHALSPSIQREIIKALANIAEEYATEKKWCYAIGYFQAAKIAYTALSERESRDEYNFKKHCLRTAALLENIDVDMAESEKKLSDAFHNILYRKLYQHKFFNPSTDENLLSTNIKPSL